MNSTVKLVLVSGLVLTTLAGCASSPPPPPAPAPVYAPPPPPPPPPPPAKKVKLVLLPAEKFLLPNAAKALNEKLAKALVPGVDERTVAAISMETAQGQAECAKADDACYGKVAKLLGGDRLLWAEMERAGKGKKKGPVKILVLLFDAEKGTLVGRAEEHLRSDVVDDSLDRLIDKALSNSEPTAPPPPPPPTASTFASPPQQPPPGWTQQPGPGQQPPPGPGQQPQPGWTPPPAPEPPPPAGNTFAPPAQPSPTSPAQ